jgi:lactate dehydrogenase-like 2-hydroxyacid dehydrogenase
MGIIGYGDIGRACGQLAKAFKMEVIALRRRPEMSEADKQAGILSRVYATGEMEEMISQCDYVVMATPFTPDTHKLFSVSAIAAMKNTAVFVNVGRGKCVDEEALVDALQQGANCDLATCIPGCVVHALSLPHLMHIMRLSRPVQTNIMAMLKLQSLIVSLVVKYSR